MANTLLTPQQITREALMLLHEKLNFITSINREYDSRFARRGAQIGDTLQIRMPLQFTARSGMTRSVQDIEERKVDLVIANVTGIDFDFTTEDLTLKVEDFNRRFLEPAMATLASNIEAQALQSVMAQVPNVIGTPGTNPANVSDYMKAKEVLNKYLAPKSNRSIRIPSEMVSDLADAVVGLFHPEREVRRMYTEGVMGRALGFEWGENEHIPPHTNGDAGGTPLVNGAGQSGSTLVTDGWTASTTIKAGTVIEIDGVYAVHPETKQPYRSLKQFVVTQDTAVDATGNATIPISPEIITTGPYQNVSNAPADNATITVKTGSPNTSYSQGIAYYRDFCTFVTADIFTPNNIPVSAREVYDNIAVSFVGDFDIDTRKMKYRLDVMWGVKVLRPELAVRVIGA